MNKIRQILLFSVLLITALIGFIFYHIKTYVPPAFDCRIPVPAFCGNSDLTENETEGKEIFHSNCAACHKKNARSTGPALYQIDSLVMKKWLTNKRNKIDSTKIEQFGIDYHRIKFSKVLNKKDISDLIEYCHN
ncbi:cytochrome c [Flavobacterium sp. CSZ]|uniref:cytochrome c n=1 Tax=Flavobacterium sp. CSZ TaxID=2783791 RepID=UPI00188C3C83|nr:cytochrome c [Flavobacterium sp. CSZ]MBF4486830.1 cytochrome c [Flavobacterium sp. CSZ]